jgi:hypothetical protein
MAALWSSYGWFVERYGPQISCDLHAESECGILFDGEGRRCLGAQRFFESLPK